MLRMNVDTRVLDCATPRISSLLPLCLIEVRYTPSGTVCTKVVELMDDLRALALELFDDLHARDQTLLAVLEILNVRNLRVQFDDLFLQQIVLFGLRVDPARVNELAAQRKNDRGEHGATRGYAEFATSYFAFLFAPGK